MTALIVGAVVRELPDGTLDVAVTEDFYRAKRQKHAKKWGVGTVLTLRLEPEEDAYTYDQIKGYWGFVVRPFCEYTGYEKHEAHLMFKAECMPEGKTSITELNREEMDEFKAAAERTARKWCPDAFVLYDAERRSA